MWSGFGSRSTDKPLLRLDDNGHAVCCRMADSGTLPASGSLPVLLRSAAPSQLTTVPRLCLSQRTGERASGYAFRSCLFCLQSSGLPRSTVHSKDGKLHPFQLGVGIMVNAHGIPVMPVKISGRDRSYHPDFSETGDDGGKLRCFAPL